MNLRHGLIAAAVATLCAGSAIASHDYSGFIQRNIHQQQRIDEGLRSGELTTEEAAWLQREQGRIARVQAEALQDGDVTEGEGERIARMQDRASGDIYQEKHNRETGDPESPSARRMQAGVERNIRQQMRIQRGIDAGELTAQEAGELVYGQARLNGRLARIARDGRVETGEQARIEQAQSRQSERIWERRHDQATRW